MTDYTLSWREVGSNVHVLNYTLGQIMSFEREDGRFLLTNLDRIIDMDGQVEKPVVEFLTSRGSRISSRAFRPPLLNLGMKFRFPTVTNLEINRRCVLRCVHCYIPVADLSSKENSAFEQNDVTNTPRLFDSLSELGVFLVVLTGGEVFMNRRFQTLLKELSERGFVVEVFSSLQFIPEWFLDLDPVKSRIGRIQTSVYSVTLPVHDEVTGVDGSMGRTLKNLCMLRDKGHYVEVATPLMASNFDTRHEIQQYFQRLGIKHSFAWPILDEYYGGTDKKSVLNISKEQFQQFCRERPDYLIKFDPTADPDAPICAAGKAVLSISANGDVFSCSQFPKAVGNIFTTDIASVYSSPDMREIANYMMKDIPAGALPYSYCVGNNYSHTGDPFKQPDMVFESLGWYERCTKDGRGRTEA